MTSLRRQHSDVVSLQEARSVRATSPESRLERVLRLFAKIRPGEGPTILILCANVFVTLAACYLLKPAADGLLAGAGFDGLSQTEVKAYVRLGQGLLLLVLVPWYARVADRLGGRAMIKRINVAFMVALGMFWLSQPGLIFDHAPHVGVAFHICVGLFGVSALTQFWMFAASLHSQEAATRVFPVIALGASAGAAVGAWTAERLITDAALGTHALMLPAAALVAVSTALVGIPERHEVRRRGAQYGAPMSCPAARSRPNSPFAAVIGNRYLAAAAAMILLLNWVSTNGENLLFGTVQALLDHQVQTLGLKDPGVIQRFLADETTAFYGSFFFWTSAIAFLLQALVASRLIRAGGLGVALLILPVIALLSHAAMALVPVLALVKIVKIAEKATSYSINNTANQLLWVPTPAEVRHRARVVIDTVVVRLGDGLAALTAFVGLNLLQVPLPYLYAFNLVLVAMWLVAAFIVAHEHDRWAAAATPTAVANFPHPRRQNRENAGLDALAA